MLFRSIMMWTVYSLGATSLQWVLHEQALLSPMMVANNSVFSAVILMLAGLFQFSALKERCLENCRSPLSFLMSDWREGTQGALIMGLKHGAYCVGCCWALMLVLFVTGVMNLLAVLFIALFVLAEKLLPQGEWLARIAGGSLIAAGLGVLMFGT